MLLLLVWSLTCSATTSKSVANSCDLTSVKFWYRPNKKKLRLRFSDKICRNSTISDYDGIKLQWIDKTSDKDMEIELAGVNITNNGWVNLFPCTDPNDGNFKNCFPKPEDSAPRPCFTLKRCIGGSNCEESVCRCGSKKTYCNHAKTKPCNFTKFEIEFCPQNDQLMKLTFLDDNCNGTYISKKDGVELQWVSSNNSGPTGVGEVSRTSSLGGSGNPYCIELADIDINDNGQVSIPKCDANTRNPYQSMNCWDEPVGFYDDTCFDLKSNQCAIDPSACDILDQQCAVCNLS